MVFMAKLWMHRSWLALWMANVMSLITRLSSKNMKMSSLQGVMSQADLHLYGTLVQNHNLLRLCPVKIVTKAYTAEIASV